MCIFEKLTLADKDDTFLTQLKEIVLYFSNIKDEEKREFAIQCIKAMQGKKNLKSTNISMKL